MDQNSTFALLLNIMVEISSLSKQTFPSGVLRPCSDSIRTCCPACVIVFIYKCSHTWAHEHLFCFNLCSPPWYHFCCGSIGMGFMLWSCLPAVSVTRCKSQPFPLSFSLKKKEKKSWWVQNDCRKYQLSNIPGNSALDLWQGTLQVGKK